jgi:hypothetical protein
VSGGKKLSPPSPDRPRHTRATRSNRDRAVESLAKRAGTAEWQQSTAHKERKPDEGEPAGFPDVEPPKLVIVGHRSLPMEQPQRRAATVAVEAIVRDVTDRSR